MMYSIINERTKPYQMFNPMKYRNSYSNMNINSSFSGQNDRIADDILDALLWMIILYFDWKFIEAYT